MATLGLAFQLSANSARMAGGVDEAVKQLARVGKAAEKTQKDVSIIKWASIAGIAKDAFSSIANAATSAAGSIASYASNVANSLDSTKDLADRLGMGVESLQALQIAAKLSGVDDVSGAVQKLAVAIGKAGESGDTKVFDKLRIDFAALQAMSPEDQFKAVQQAIASLPTPAERAAAAVSVFGKSGVELLPLMEQNLAEIEDRMRRLGAIVGEEQVSAIADMNDSLDMVKATFTGIIGQVEGNLAPVVTRMANEFLGFVEGFESVNGDGGTGIANAITEGLFDVIDALAGVVDRAIVGFESVSQNFEIISFTLGNAAKNAIPGVGLGIDMARAAAGAAADQTAPEATPAGDIVSDIRKKYRESQTPEAKAKRDQQKKDRDDARQADIDAKNAADRDKKAAEEAQKSSQQKADFDLQMYAARRANELAIAEADRKAKEKKDKELASLEDKMTPKADQIFEITGGRAAALGRKSNEALKASDLRSSEGMSQFLALATGREDPALAEYRKQTRKLEELRDELRALQLEQVTILNGAGA